MALDSRELDALISVLSSEKRSFESIGTEFQRAFSRTAQFKAACAMNTILRDPGPSLLLSPTQRLAGIYLMHDGWRGEAKFGPFAEAFVEVVAKGAAAVRAQLKRLTAEQKASDLRNAILGNGAGCAYCERRLIVQLMCHSRSRGRDLSQVTPESFLQASLAELSKAAASPQAVGSLLAAPERIVHMKTHVERTRPVVVPGLKSFSVKAVVVNRPSENAGGSPASQLTPHNVISPDEMRREVDLALNRRLIPEFVRPRPPMCAPADADLEQSNDAIAYACGAGGGIGRPVDSSAGFGMELLWDYTMGSTMDAKFSTNATARGASGGASGGGSGRLGGGDPRATEARALAHKALQMSISPAEQSSLIKLLSDDDTLAHRLGVTPANLPLLVERNPRVAYNLLVKLIGSPQIIKYFTTLVKMKLSLHSMDVVNKLTMSVELPAEFVHLYISNCIASCEAISDKYRQARLARLVCVFLQSLIRNRVVRVDDVFVEVQAFCIQFSKIKEATGLFRLLKAMEPTVEASPPNT